MRHFTGRQYVHIDIANQYGLDKFTWQKRLDWVQDNMLQLDQLAVSADCPVLYRKAVRASCDARTRNPTGYIMGLDATASGLQIMAALSGCHKTAEQVNLINTGKREDVYGNVAKQMNLLPGVMVSRDIIKKPLMTTFYGSKARPKQIFGDGTSELLAFYEILNRDLPGAMQLMDIMQSCWNPMATEYRWTLPDDHEVVAKVMATVDKKIEVDELHHATFTHRAYINIPQDFGLSLAANIIHSIDGWIVREMLRGCHNMGFQMAPIHDSFWCHPNHMNTIRELYGNLLITIADSNMFQDIMNQITGQNGVYTKLSNDLSLEIMNAEYLLS